MRLPNADRAVVDLIKLTDYCLSPIHPVGKHKAVVFRAALGLEAPDSAWLRRQILKAAAEGQAVLERSDVYGDRYRLDFELVTPKGRTTVRSAWIVRQPEYVPRLTTCYVLSR